MESTQDWQIRRADQSDVAAIVALLADDELGATRESPGDPAYTAAFERIDEDPNQFLAVAEQDGRVLATMQLTFIPGLSRRGMTRAQIEAVRVDGACRGQGIGQQLVEWAIAQSRRRGCGLVQLTSDASRTSAHAFYERLGFTASHLGMKLVLRD